MSRSRTLAIAREYVTDAHEFFHAVDDAMVQIDAFRLSVHLTYLLAHGSHEDEILAARVSMHAIAFYLFSGDGLTADTVYNVLRGHTRRLEQPASGTGPTTRSKVVGRA